MSSYDHKEDDPPCPCKCHTWKPRPWAVCHKCGRWRHEDQQSLFPSAHPAACQSEPAAVTAVVGDFDCCAAPVCEHHWVSQHKPGHILYWIKVCSICHEVDWDYLDEIIKELAIAGIIKGEKYEPSPGPVRPAT